MCFITRLKGTGSNSRLISYIQRYPETVLLIEFCALLQWAAFLLAEGNSVQANGLGVYAFFSLVLGIAFRTVREVWRKHSEAVEKQ